MEASDIIFWVSVFLALYGGQWLTRRARKNNFDGYEDTFCDACECDPCDCGFGSY